MRPVVLKSAIKAPLQGTREAGKEAPTEARHPPIPLLIARCILGLIGGT